MDTNTKKSATINNAQLFPQCNNTMNFMTQQGHTNFQGYDVSGCRLDNNKTNQNMCIYGPPLSWCNTYNKNNSGTLWYPLN